MKSTSILLCGALLIFGVCRGTEQTRHTSGRWAVGLRAGPSLWFNDANQRIAGMGGDVEARLGLCRWLSVGATLGHIILKSGQSPVRPELPEEYLKLRSWSFSTVARAYLLPGKAFSPYFSLGLGGMLYTRVDGLEAYVPDDRTRAGLHFPISIGAELFAAKSLSVDLSAGLTVLDDQTDRFKYGSPDSYLAVRVGVNFYFGVSGDDDDDGDGLTNAEEWQLGTNPTNPDTDEDGLTDGDEVRKYHTYPLRVDTDGDRVNDGDEVLKFHTNPLLRDTDGDGLTDGDELFKYLTDPLKPDTDGGGVGDGDEVDRSTNPRDPADDFLQQKPDKH